METELKPADKHTSNRKFVLAALARRYACSAFEALGEGSDLALESRSEALGCRVHPNDAAMEEADRRAIRARHSAR